MEQITTTTTVSSRRGAACVVSSLVLLNIFRDRTFKHRTTVDKHSRPRVLFSRSVFYCYLNVHREYSNNVSTEKIPAYSPHNELPSIIIIVGVIMFWKQRFLHEISGIRVSLAFYAC